MPLPGRRDPAVWNAGDTAPAMVTAEANRPAEPEAPRREQWADRTTPQRPRGPAGSGTLADRAIHASSPVRGGNTWPDTATARVRIEERPLDRGWSEALPAPFSDPMAPRFGADPFAESALEEAMADALERAALEAGIDLT